MNVTSIRYCKVLLIALLVFFAALGKKVVLERARGAVYRIFIPEGVQFGGRWAAFRLVDSERIGYNHRGEVEGFLGSITKLEERQDVTLRPFLRYLLLPQVYVALGWEKMDMRARSYYGHYDGDFIYSGPSIQIERRGPGDKPFIPYGSLGVAYLSAEVEHNPDWYAEGRRRLVAKDTPAFVVTVGTQVQLTENLAVDIFCRRLFADFQVEYVFQNQSRGVFDFPLHNWAVGVTPVWSF